MSSNIVIESLIAIKLRSRVLRADCSVEDNWMPFDWFSADLFLNWRTSSVSLRLSSTSLCWSPRIRALITIDMRTVALLFGSLTGVCWNWLLDWMLWIIFEYWVRQWGQRLLWSDDCLRHSKQNSCKQVSVRALLTIGFWQTGHCGASDWLVSDCVPSLGLALLFSLSLFCPLDLFCWLLSISIIISSNKKTKLLTIQKTIV